MGDWLDAKPAWWGTVKSFATSPTTFIKTKISGVIVGAALAATNAGSEAIDMAVDAFLAATVKPVAAGLTPLAVGGGTIEDLIFRMNVTMIDLASTAGPLAPFVVLVMWAGLAAVVGYVSLVAIRWLIRQVVRRA